MSDTTTKRAEEVALLHETRSLFAGSEKEKTFDLATAALLRALATERDALRAALDKAANALSDAGRNRAECYNAWAEARAALGEKNHGQV